MMVRQPLWAAVGMIHAESVIPVVRSSEAEPATRPGPVEPLKLNAPPYRPCADQVAPPTTVPRLPLPEASAALVPVPSLNAHAPTSPGGGGGVFGVVASATDE